MPPSAPSAPHWLPRPPGELHRRTWEDGTVVYDAVSGDTHLLRPGHALLLDLVGPDGADLDALAAGVAAGEGRPLAAGEREILAETLGMLAGLGLLRRAAP